jgi:hypothetical protein
VRGIPAHEEVICCDSTDLGHQQQRMHLPALAAEPLRSRHRTSRRCRRDTSSQASRAALTESNGRQPRQLACLVSDGLERRQRSARERTRHEEFTLQSKGSVAYARPPVPTGPLMLFGTGLRGQPRKL